MSVTSPAVPDHEASLNRNSASGFLSRDHKMVVPFGTDAVFFDVYTLPGMMWVDGIQHAPIAFLLMSAAFRQMDPSLEESALLSGASIAQAERSRPP